MTTYRLTPNQLTLLGFVLGASAAIAPDVNQVKRIHILAQKAVDGANNGTFTVDEPESQQLISAVETHRGSIASSTAWPQLDASYQELISTFRAGIAKGTQEGSRSAAGR